MTASPPTTEPATAPPAASRWWIDALWLAALAAWSAAYCLTAAPKLGVTYDEPFYLDAGMESWRGWTHDTHTPFWAHEYSVTHGVMPLPPDVVTLPVFVQEVLNDEYYGTAVIQATGPPDLAAHTAGLARNLQADRKVERLRGARAMTLLWLWLLVVSAWRLGRAAGGPWAGRIAAGLLAADPNVLAHASLATTDVAVTAALMAFARAVYAGRDGDWWKRVTLPGLWFGVAALCKISALLYGGLILVALEVAHRFATGALARPAEGGLGAWAKRAGGAVLRSVLAAAAVILIGLTVAVAYCGIPPEGARPFEKVAAQIPKDEPLKPTYDRWAKEAGRVPHAVSAFAFQWWSNSRGRPSFLNGTYYPEAYRWYFPELLMMKLPVPIFLLALAALPRPRAVANTLALVALLMFVPLLNANLQIGVRLALPVIAVGYVAVAVALGRGYPRCAPGIALPAVLAMAATSAWVWPHALGYLNQPSGGLEAAPRRVSDSNLDWGQGLPDLRAWHAANGEPPLTVWYFGADRAVQRPPFRHFPLEAVPVTSADEFRKLVGPQVLAVGCTVVTLHPDAPPAKVVALEYLRTRRPLARTATFVLYDFRDPNGPPPLEQ